MSIPEQSILHFTRFTNIDKWSANTSVYDKMNTVFPLVSLSKILKRAKEPITVEEGRLYKRITVRLYGQGVLQRDELYGKDIGTKKQYIAHDSQLIVSRIDARNGAFGLVPNELDGAIVTNDFWLFDIHDAMPQYLALLLSSEFLQQYWQSQSSGTTNRQRLNEMDFLASKIVLPSLAIQQKLIDKYNYSMRQAMELQRNAKDVENNINRYLVHMLEAVQEEKWSISTRMLFTTRLQSLQRWDVWANSGEYISSKYKTRPFRYFTIGNPMYGASEKAIKKRSDVRYIRITDIQEDGSLGEDFVSAANIDPKYLLRDGDFLIARSGNTVGKTFLYSTDYGKAIYAGYLVRYVIDREKIDPQYLLYYTKCIIFKTWIKNNQRIFGQPNINGQEYLSAPVILPPLEIQKEIVKEIQTLRKRIKALCQQSECLRQRAKKEFEEAVFSGI